MKLREVIATATKFLDDVKILVERRTLSVAGLSQVALASIKDDADLVAAVLAKQSVQLFVVRLGDIQATRLKHDALVSIIVDRDFRVGGVAGVHIVVVFTLGLIAKSAAVTDDRARVFVDSQSPAGNVRLMRPLVA